MNWSWVWESSVLVLAGITLLRIAGRKSIAQSTAATTVIIISIGTMVVQPVAFDPLWKALASASVFIFWLIVVEYLQLKWNWFEGLLSGRSITMIENGQVVPNNMRKLRISGTSWRFRLRQIGVSNIADVKTATLEPNGQIGYELTESARPVTVGDLERIFGLKPDMSLDQSIIPPQSIPNCNKGIPMYGQFMNSA
ncbi:DUF421 domain-containing protein [Paenibacillus macerans]|uniref:DUF421 domain-containing protein n=1 Tax=Paenibacillus macerans TaxID=44252 RepID=UPI001F0DD93B|nr:YetF domain-containing protein [Paenibacillus macerans]MBS5912908.1 DUF421 domain-containing protein [Paenibacillus macerans]UMV48506.1 DUF421 domain-containing protein [Paenibacillus macerans]